MRAFLFFIFLFSYTHLRCQSYGDLINLFNQKKYGEALVAGKNYLNTDSADARVYGLIGRCYNATKQFSAAIPYHEKAIALDRDATFVSGWAYAALGQAHIKTGETEKGVSELHKAVELNKTQNSVNFALNILKRMGQDAEASNLNSMPAWVVMEGRHIKYFFEDTTGISDSVKRFIMRHERAFDTLNSVFEANLPVKISLYVWLNEARAKKVLNCPHLGFATPEKYTANVRINQTIGHELTHVLSYWAWGSTPQKRSRFVNEGLAVAFNLTHENKIENAKNAMAIKKLHNVMQVWNQEDALGEGILYPVAGAFMRYLYQHGSFEDFKKLIKDQSLASARKIYGKKNFEDMVGQFNALMGL